MATFKFTGNAATAYGTGFDFLRDTLTAGGASASGGDQYLLTTFNYNNGLSGNLNKSVTFETVQTSSGTVITSLNFVGRDTANASVQLLSGSGLRAPIEVNWDNYSSPAQAAAVNKFVQELFKGNDDFRISGVISSIWGDYNTIASDLNVKLGNDTFMIDYGTTASSSYIFVYGDAVSVAAGASARGGNDFILAPSAASTRIYGDFGSVDATAHVTYGNDEIRTGSGGDIVYGDGLDPALAAGGDDYIYTASGSDAIYAGGGDDILNGGAGADVLDGGSGFDVAVYQETTTLLSTLVVDLEDNSLNTNYAEGDVLTGIEGLTGRIYNGVTDDLRGNGAANTLSGLGGNDILSGRGGNDRLSGGGGADQLDGGAGSDSLDYRTSSAGVTINIASNTASGGDAEGDTISSFEAVYGSDFSDKLTGNGAANFLRGYLGNDTAVGGAGNDQVYGYAGKDVLYGGSGNDLISGGTENDKITGDSGADDLYGGAGADTFIYKSATSSTVAAAGRDTIFDFSRSQGDKIDLSLIDAKSGVSGNNGFTFIGTASYSGHAGELRITKDASDTYIYGDTNGDGKSEFRIHLDDAVALSAGDFIL